MKIEVEGSPHNIVDFQLVSPGKGGSFVRTKLKNMLNEAVIERTFKTGDKFGSGPDLEQLEFQYLYREGEHYLFHEPGQLRAGAALTALRSSATTKDFISRKTPSFQVLFYNGKAIGVELADLRRAQGDRDHGRLQGRHGRRDQAREA